MQQHRDRSAGFTLIELSIVLVVIGLLVGGVLVGRDLMAASAIRAQISQIEKYQQAVNTFKGKYGYLPGDIPAPEASRFGFSARGTFLGMGDGNGIIEGNMGLAAVTIIDPGNTGMTSTPGVTALQALRIDQKMDDGLPQYGNILAKWYNQTQYFNWVGGVSYWIESPYTTSTAGSSTSCFDNNNIAGAPQQYSVTQNNGAGVNCALSFKFQ